MSVQIYNDRTNWYPPYLLVVTEAKLNKIKNRITYFFKRKMLIENDIYLMLYNYDYNKKNILFYNNTIKCKTIYKKFKINDNYLYIPILEYSKFYLNYKIKMCTRIVETLGVHTIKYDYNEFTETQFNIGNKVNIYNAEIGVNVNNIKNESNINKEDKIYERGLCSYLFYSIENFEKKILDIYHTFIDKNDFIQDFDLRNLIHSRLIGNLFDYDVKYETNFIDSKEVDFALGFASLKNMDVNLKEMINKKLSVNVKIVFYKYEELITSENMQMDDRCLQIIKNDKSLQHLLTNYIEKHIESKSSFEVYYFMKIAKPQYLLTLINNVNTSDDLKENGGFFSSLKNTLYSSLLTFDDNGLSKLQDIYIMKLRKNRNIETDDIEVTCFNIRCNKNDCSCKKYKSLKSIYCYIIRAYNHANPKNIITYGFNNNKLFSITIFYIIMNLKHFTSYDIFIEWTTIKIDNCINIIKTQKPDTTNPVSEEDNTSVESNNDDVSVESNNDNALNINSDKQNSILLLNNDLDNEKTTSSCIGFWG